MNVNIHTLTFNRLEMTKLMFKSIIDTVTIPYIHVFFNNFYDSDDKTLLYLQELKEKYKFIRILNSPVNIGIGKAVNTSINCTPDFDYYIKIDNDVVLETKGWLSNMIKICKYYNDEIVLAGQLDGILKPYYHKHYEIIHDFKIGFTAMLGGAWRLVPGKIIRSYGYLSEEGLRGPAPTYGTDSPFYGLKGRLQISEIEEKIQNKAYWIKAHQR